MSLPTCPSCGQSVLEDDAVDCPFCGAAMDGSRGAKNTPRPKANPVANRPGARKSPPPPPSPVAPAAKSDPVPVSRPAAGGRPGGKPKVDEDDPFGMGNTTHADAVQATLKPEKGRLLKVVCPMCEQVGFVPKNAVGRSVRCANEKCMVPIFKAVDPAEQAGERKPVRLSDEAEAARRLEEASKPRKRSPLKMYALIAIVGLASAGGIVVLLNKPRDTSDLDRPITTGPDPGTAIDEEAEARLLEEKKKAEAAAAAASNPRTIAGGYVKRMITLARVNVRDKAMARSMTADVFLRLGDAAQAAQELNQLGNVEGSRPFYRIGPQISAYWRLLDTDADAAGKAFQAAAAELSTLPASGRAAADVAVALSAAAMNQGLTQDAFQLTGSRRLDATTPANRDTMAGNAWLSIAGRCRDAGIPAPAALDALRWLDPYSVAVAADLAIHRKWARAAEWAGGIQQDRAAADAIVVISEIARLLNGAADAVPALEGIRTLNSSADSLRARAAIAALSGDAGKLEALLTALDQPPAPAPVAVPKSSELAQQNAADRSAQLNQAAAMAEIARAAVVLNRMDDARRALQRMEAELAAAAPPTQAIREMAAAMTGSEAAYKKKIASELRVADENQFASMFRNYRRHLEQLATAAEDRRLCEILLLSRVARAGGASVIEAQLTSPEVRQHVMLDALSGMIPASATIPGGLPAAGLKPETGLFRGQAQFGDAQPAVLVGAAMEFAWTAPASEFAGGLIALSETGVGNTWPAMRQALITERIMTAAGQSKIPADLLTAILSVPHEAWREELLAIASRGLAGSSQEQLVDQWMSGQKLKPLEQIAVLYGLAQGVLDRPAPTAPEGTPAIGSTASTGGN